MAAVSRPGSVGLFERPLAGLDGGAQCGERFLGLKGTAIMAWWRNGIGDRCAMAQHRGIVEAERQPNDGGGKTWQARIALLALISSGTTIGGGVGGELRGGDQGKNGSVCK